MEFITVVWISTLNVNGKGKSRLDRDHALYYSAVIGASWLGLIDQIDIDLGGRHIGFNTDASFWEFDEFNVPDDIVVDKSNLESITQPFTMNRDEFKPRGELFVVKREQYQFEERVWTDILELDLKSISW